MDTLNKKFIIVHGSGQSNLARHPCSYHYALYDASKIHSYNLVGVSSVLSAESTMIKIDHIDMPPHGSTLMCIMANAEGEEGESICAGIIYADLYKDEDCSIRYGGFVCEHTRKGTSEQMDAKLRKIIQEGYQNTFAKDGLFMGEPEVVIEVLTVEKRYGNAIVAIVFIDNKFIDENYLKGV
jgi:arginine decarboxylase